MKIYEQRDNDKKVTCQRNEIHIAVSPRLNHALESRSEAAIIKLDVVKATRWHRNAIDQIIPRVKSSIPLSCCIRGFVFTFVVKYTLSTSYVSMTRVEFTLQINDEDRDKLLKPIQTERSRVSISCPQRIAKVGV